MANRSITSGWLRASHDESAVTLVTRESWRWLVTRRLEPVLAATLFSLVSQLVRPGTVLPVVRLGQYRTVDNLSECRNNLPSSIMDLLTLFLTLLVGALVLRLLCARKSSKFEEFGIVHTKQLASFVNFGRILLKRCTLQDIIGEAYGLDDQAEYVGHYDFGSPVIVIRSPELIKSITVKNFDHFVDHRSFVDVDADPLFAGNLFSLRGEKWREMRNLLSPAFTGSKMRSMFRLMSKCGENFGNFLAESSNGEPNVLDIKDAFARYTNDVIATCAFGIGVDSMRNPENDFYVLGKKAAKFDGLRVLKFFLMINFPRLSKLLRLRLMDEKTAKFFEGVVRETIETRDREGITRPDMMQLMMETRGKKSVGSPGLTILDMTAQAFVFFFGGFDTASTVMSFAAMEIAVNDEVQRQLVEDIDAVLEATDGEPTYEAVNGMEYLDAVINETLRLYPVQPFLDRQCVKRFELPPSLPGRKSIVVEPGENVWFPTFSVHRDPRYHREPNKFDPGRFIGSRKNDIEPFSYLPFGQGPRMCIGNRFAILEAKVAIFHLLSKCHVKPSPKTISPITISKASVVMKPEGGYWLQLETRNTDGGTRSGRLLD